MPNVSIADGSVKTNVRCQKSKNIQATKKKPKQTETQCFLFGSH